MAGAALFPARRALVSCTTLFGTRAWLIRLLAAKSSNDCRTFGASARRVVAGGLEDRRWSRWESSGGNFGIDSSIRTTASSLDARSRKVAGVHRARTIALRPTASLPATGPSRVKTVCPKLRAARGLT